MGDLALIPGLGRFPGGGYGNSFQYFCLQNPHGQRSLEGYSAWGHKELDMTEQLSQIYVCVCVCVYIYIYIYIYTHIDTALYVYIHVYISINLGERKMTLFRDQMVTIKNQSC